MKKVLSILLSLVLLMCTAAVSPAAADEDDSPVIYFGDVDESGSITATDALIALQFAVGKTSLSARGRLLANADAKGVVTASDALLILQCSVGKITAVPAQSYGIETSPYTGMLALKQSNGELELEGPVVITQEEAQYNSNLNIPSDSVMAYVRGAWQVSSSLGSWAKAAPKGKTIDCMIAINRSFGEEYYKAYPDRAQGRKDSQTRKDGSRIIHGADGDYMVPTDNFIEYKWSIIEEILKYNVSYIAFEEPEMWQASGYSEGFKEEWKKYYGTDWEDQESSPEAKYKSSRLKVYLFEKAIKTLADRIHAEKPEVKIVLASHGTLNYTAWGIVSSIGTLANLDCIDGIIGQTWSDTIKRKMKYDGASYTDGFTEAYAEFTGYGDLVSGDKWLFALSDAAADGADGWDDHKKWYERTVTAQMMFTDINRYEFIWPSRAYSGAPKEYRMMQLNVITAQNELAGKASELYAGTQGIYAAYSDTASWQFGSSAMPHSTAATGMESLTVPLIRKGIPVKGVSLEQVRSAEDLKDVKLLILSYDCMKPQTEQVNTAIAEWVKNGGQLLYLGGRDGFEDINGTWWGDKNTTPLKDLMEKLSIGDVKISQSVKSDGALTWGGPSGYVQSANGLNMTEKLAGFSVKFEGANSILSCGGESVGITSKSGKGNVTVIGLSSSFYSDVAGGAGLMRELTEYALSLADIQYLETNSMVVRRGDYVIAQGLEGETVLKGKYIDIFDKDLTVYTDPVIGENVSAMYKDVSKYFTGQTPKLTHVGGLCSDLEEEAGSTKFTNEVPNNTRVSIRIALNGKKLDSAQIIRTDTNAQITANVAVDENSDTLHIWYLGTYVPVNITVNYK